MSKAGWYPDPGGQQGMFRWWDGMQWTPQLTANPYAGPPQADRGPRRSGVAHGAQAVSAGRQLQPLVLPQPSQT